MVYNFTTIGGTPGNGPSFTLPDGTIGRIDGTPLVANPNDANGALPNSATDIEFQMTRLDPSNNGNRVLEIRIPKTGLGSAFTDGIIGIEVEVDDDDNGGDRDHALFHENAGENLDGTDEVLNASGGVRGNLDTVAGGKFNNGMVDQNANNFECSWPRFLLEEFPPPNAAQAGNAWSLYQ